MVLDAVTAEDLPLRRSTRRVLTIWDGAMAWMSAAHRCLIGST